MQFASCKQLSAQLRAQAGRSKESCGQTDFIPKPKVVINGMDDDRDKRLMWNYRNLSYSS
jgi:hypothetical protein